MTTAAGVRPVYLELTDLPDDLAGDLDCAHYPHGADGASCDRGADLQVIDDAGPVYVCRLHAPVVALALLTEQLAP